MSDTDRVDTLRELAVAVGRSHITLKRWSSLHGMPRHAEGGWSISEVRQWAVGRGLLATDAEADAKLALIEATAEHKRECARLAEMRHRALARELVRSSEVVAILRRVADHAVDVMRPLVERLPFHERQHKLREMQHELSVRLNAEMDALQPIGDEDGGSDS